MRRDPTIVMSKGRGHMTTLLFVSQLREKKRTKGTTCPDMSITA